jgi:hypothetical protein
MGLIVGLYGLKDRGNGLAVQHIGLGSLLRGYRRIQLFNLL